MKVLILTSSTGSGHNMRARAFSLWAKKERPDSWDVTIHAPLEQTHGLYKAGVETYNIIQRHAPWAHHLYFNYLELASMHHNADRILGADTFIRTVQSEQPDLIFSVHGHTNHAYFELARRALPQNPPVCVTYCGELYGGYGLSKHWINPDSDCFIGAVPEICHAAIHQHQMPETKTLCGGFLLRPAFYESPLSEADRRHFLLGELNLNPDQFTLLLSTGDAGANNHIRFLSSLEKAGLPLQVIALCGRNQATFEQIAHWAKTGTPKRTTRVIPLAYRKDMHQLMQSVSAIVARPGTGATSESILSRCPIIHNGMGGVMPQEWITVKYCRSHGFDHTIHSPGALTRKVREWIDHPEIPATIRSRMDAAAPQSTPRELLTSLESLEQIVRSRNQPQRD